MKKINKILLSLLLVISFNIYGQSALPAEVDNFLQVTGTAVNGDEDDYMVVFFEVPDTVTGPIYFSVYDPGLDNTAGIDNNDPDQGDADAWDFQLLGGNGTISGSGATGLDHGQGAASATAYTGTTLSTISGVGGVAGDANDEKWVYFSSVYPSQGEKIGKNYYFKVVAYGSGNNKNAYRLDASYSNTGNPTGVTSIRSFAYAWTLATLTRNGTTWGLYPFVPESAVGNIVAKMFDVDRETTLEVWRPSGINAIPAFTDSDAIDGNWFSNPTAANGNVLAEVGQVNSTWHAIITEITGTAMIDTSVFAFEGSSPSENYRIYAAPYIPPSADHVVISPTSQTTEQNVYQTYNLYVADSSGNTVPYVKNLYITADSADARIFDVSDQSLPYLVTTNSEGYVSVDLKSLSAETVTFTITTDGTNSSSRLPISGTLGVNDSITATFTTTGDTIPVMSSASTTTFTEGNSQSLPVITISDANVANITAANDVYIRIPDSLNATFSQVPDVVLSAGTGAIGTTSLYDTKTIVIDVTTDLQVTQTLTIGGVTTLDIGATNTSGTGYLEMSYQGPSGPWSVIDDKKITIDPITLLTWSGGVGLWNVSANWGGNQPNNVGESALITGATSVVTLNLDAPTIYSLIISSDAVLNLNDDAVTYGNPVLSGSFTNDGILRLQGNRVVPSSPWVPTDSGTIEYAGTTTVLGAGANYYNLNIEGTVTLDRDIVVYGNLTINAAGVLNANGHTITVYGNWNNSLGGTFNYGSGQVIFIGSGNTTVSGSSTFYDLSCTVGGKTLIFTSGSTQTITGLLTLKGSSGQKLNIQSSTAAVFNLTPVASTSDIQYVDIAYSNFTTAATAYYSTNGGSNGVNLTFDTGTINYWVGDNSSDWNDPLNWTLDTFPTTSQAVVIPYYAVNFPPIVNAIPTNSVAGITVEGSASLTINAFTLATTGDIQNDGTITMSAGSTLSGKALVSTGVINNSGASTITLTGNTDISGSFTTPGNSTINLNGSNKTLKSSVSLGDININGNTSLSSALVSVGNITIATGISFDVTSNNYAVELTSLNILGTGVFNGRSGTLTLSNSGTINVVGTGTFYNLIFNGTTTASTGFTVLNDLTINASSVLTSTAGTTINIGRNWVNNAGTTGFIETTSTVVFNENNTNHTISGNSEFYNLTLDASGAGSPVTLLFEGGSTQTIVASGLLNLQGFSGQELSLNSTNTSLWTIDLVSAVTPTINYVNFDWADAGTRDIVALNSSEGVNNDTTSPLWALHSTTTWQGPGTDWDTAGNWSNGIPTTITKVVIPTGATPFPILSANAFAYDIEIQANASVDLNNFDLDISNTLDLQADGIIIAGQNGTITGATIPSDRGMVIYSGDTGVNNITGLSLGNTYFDLLFKDSIDGDDTWTISNNLVIATGGSLELDTGNLNLSTYSLSFITAALGNYINSGTAKLSLSGTGSVVNIVAVPGVDVIPGLVEYTGTTAALPMNYLYENLIFSATSSITVSSALSVSGYLTIDNGAIFNSGVTVGGQLTNNDTISIDNNVLSFDTYTGDGADIITTDGGTITTTGDGGVIKTLTVAIGGVTLNGSNGTTGITITDPLANGITTTGKVSLNGALTTLTVTSGNLTQNGNISTSSNTIITTGSIVSGDNSLSIVGNLSGGGSLDTSLISTGNILDINGNVTIDTILAPLPTSTGFTVAGNWNVTNFTHSSGTVTLDGTTQSVTSNAQSFNNLNINSSTSASTVGALTTVNNLSILGDGAITAGANITIGGDLEISGTGSLDLVTFNLLVTGTTNATNLLTGSIDGGSGTLTFTGDFQIGSFTPSSSTSNFTGSSVIFNTVVPNGGTIDLDGAGQGLTTNGQTFNNITKSTAGNLTVTGDLTATGNLGITLAGSNVILADGAHSITGNVSGLGTLTASAITTGSLNIDGNIATLGNFSAPSTITTVAGNWNVTNFTHSSGTVTLDGTTQSVTSNAQSFNNLNINSSTSASTVGALTTVNNLSLLGDGAITAGANITIGGDLEISGTGSLDLVTFNLLVTGTTNATNLLTGSIDGGSGTLTFTGDFQIGSFTPSSSTSNFTGSSVIFNTVVPNGGTIDLDGAGQGLTTNGQTFNNITKSTAGNLTVTGVLTATGNLGITLAGGNVILPDGAHSITGNVSGLGTLTASAITTGSLNIDGNIATLGNFSAPSTITTVAGNWNVTNFTHSSGTVTLDGTIQSVTSNAQSFNNLNINSSTSASTVGALTTVNNLSILGDGAITAGANITIGGDLEISGTGSLDLVTFNLLVTGTTNATNLLTGAIDGGSGTLTFTGDFQIGSFTPSSSTSNFTGSSVIFNTVVPNGGTIDLDGAGQGLTTNDQTFNNITKSTAGNLTVTGDLTATGNLGITLAGGNVILPDGAHSITGNVSGLGTLTASAITTGSLNIDGNIATLGNFSAPSTITTVAGNWNVTNFTHSSGTIDLDGAGQGLTTNGQTFNNITKSTAGNLTVTGVLTATGNLGITLAGSNVILADGVHSITGNVSGLGTLTASAITTGSLNIDGNIAALGNFSAPSTITTVAGNWNVTNFTHSSGTVTLDGTTQSVTSNAQSFNNLNINSSTSASTVGALTTVNNLSILGDGAITAGANITIGGDLEISGTGSLDLVTFNLLVTGTTNATNLLTGSIDGGSGTLTFTGDFQIGSFTPSSTTSNFTGSSVIFNTVVPNGGTIDFNGAVQGFTTNDQTFNNITKSTAGNLTVTGDLTATGNLGITLAGGNVILPDGAHSITGNVSGLGTLTASAITTGSLNIDGNIATLGSFSAPSTITTVAGSWNVALFTNNSGTVDFDGVVDQTVTTNNQTFNNITKTSAGVLIVTGNLTAGGTFTAPATTRISGDWNVTTLIHNNGTVDFNGVVAQAVTTNNQIFYDLTRSTAFNINVTGQLLATNDVLVTGGNIVLPDEIHSIGGNLSGTGSLDASAVAGGNSLNIDGNIATLGSFSAPSAITTVAGNWNVTTLTNNSGNITFDGGIAQAVTTNNQTFYDLTRSTAFNLNVTGQFLTTNDVVVTGGNIVLPDANHSIGGNLSGSGSLNASAVAGGNSLNIDGNLSLTGTFTAPSSNTTIAGSWSVSTFVHSSGIIEFDTTATATISGSNIFYEFKSTVNNKNIIFEAGTTQDISVITLNGSAGNLLVLRSSIPGTRWNIKNSVGVDAISFLSIEDGGVDDTGSSIAAGANSLNNGNNDISGISYWTFTTPTITWVGGTIGFLTDWEVATNWSPASIPTFSNNVIIPNTVNKPTLTKAAYSSNLDLSDALSQLTTDGFDLNISGTLDNSGTIIRTGNETVTKTDATKGTVRYVTGAGNIENYTGDDYFNLEIASGTKSLASNITVTNDLTIDGVLTPGANSLIMTGATADITGSGTATFGTLDITGTTTLGTNITVNNSLTGSGTLNGGSNTIDLGGSWSITTFGHDTSIVNFNSTTNIASGDAFNFYNLNITGTSTLTVAEDITVNNDINIATGATLSLGTNDLNLVRNRTSNLGSITGTGQVNWTGLDFGTTITMSNFNTLTLDLVIPNNITISNDFTIVTSGNVIFNGTVNGSGSNSLTVSTPADNITFNSTIGNSTPIGSGAAGSPLSLTALNIILTSNVDINTSVNPVIFNGATQLQGLTLNSASPLTFTGTSLSISAGAVVINTTGALHNLVFDTPITSNQQFTTTTNGSDIIFNATSDLTSTNGTITLTATSGNVTLDDQTLISGTDVINISGGTVTLGGLLTTYSGVGSAVTINTSGTLADAGDTLVDISTSDNITLNIATGTLTDIEILSPSVDITTTGAGNVIINQTSQDLIIGTASINNGNLTINTITSGNIRVDSITASGSVTLNSAGNILESGTDVGIDLTAPTINFTSNGNVSFANPLEINSNNITISNIGAGGIGINNTSTGLVSIPDINTTSGNINYTGTGSVIDITNITTDTTAGVITLITDNNITQTAGMITSKSIRLETSSGSFGATGSPILTTVDLAALSATGNIYLTDVNALEIGTVNTLVGLTVGGTLVLNTTGDLTITDSVTNSGDAPINLTSSGGNTIIGNNISFTNATVSDLKDLTFNSPVVLNGGSYTIDTTNPATVDLDVNFLSTVNGLGDLSINSGIGDVNFSGIIGGTTAITSLTVNSAQRVDFNGIGIGSNGVTGNVDVTTTIADGLITLSGANYRVGGSVILNGGNTDNGLYVNMPIASNIVTGGTFTSSSLNTYLYGTNSANAITLSSTGFTFYNLHISLQGKTVTLTGNLNAQNIVLYNGDINSNGYNITTTEDLVLVGSGYDIADPDTGVVDLFSYNNANRVTAINTSILPNFNSLYIPGYALPGAGSYTGRFTDLSGSIISVGGNFYNNGANMLAASPWTLSLIDNNNVTASFAEAYNMTVQNSLSNYSVSAVENNTVISSTNWFTLRPAFDITATGLATMYDDVIRFKLASGLLFENSNNEILTAVQSGIVGIHNNTITGVDLVTYTDPECTIPTTGAGDISVFYLRVENDPAYRWNTDATGLSPGAITSSDRGRSGVAAVNRTTIPDIVVEKASATVFHSLLDSNKNRITHRPIGSKITDVKDQTSPAIVLIEASRHASGTAFTYDGHNYFDITYSEDVTYNVSGGPLSTFAVNSRSNGYAYNTYGGELGYIEQNGSNVDVIGLFSYPGKYVSGSFDGIANTNTLYSIQPNKLRIDVVAYKSGGIWPGYLGDVTNDIDTYVKITNPSFDQHRSNFNGDLADLIALQTDPDVITQLAQTNKGITVPINNDIYDSEGNVLEPSSNTYDAYFKTMAISGTGWDVYPPYFAKQVLENGTVTDVYEIYFLDQNISPGNRVVDNIAIHIIDDHVMEPFWVSWYGWSQGASAPELNTRPDPIGGIRDNPSIGLSSAYQMGLLGETLTGTAITGMSTNVDTYMLRTLNVTDYAINVADDNYFSIQIDESQNWLLNNQMGFSYSAPTGRITDYAGNLMPNSNSSLDPFQWIPPEILLSLSVVDEKTIYIQFTKNVYDTDPLTLPRTGITKDNFTLISSEGNTITSLLAVDGIATETAGKREFLITMANPISANDMVNARLQMSPLDVYDLYGTDTGLIQKRLTDLGVGLVYPVYANDSLHQDDRLVQGEGSLRDFDGTGRLLPEDIVIATKIEGSNNQNLSLSMFYDIDTDLSGAVDYDTSDNVYNSNLWLPAVLQGTYIFNNLEARELTPTGTDGDLKLFSIDNDDSELNIGSTFEFLYKLGAAEDLYCVSLPLGGSTLTDLVPWQISIEGLKTQRGGVTIVNNVINPLQGQSTEIFVEQEKAGMSTISVMSLDGTIVKVLQKGRLSVGSYRYLWNGTNKSGKPVARGIYFIKVISPGVDESRKVMIVK